MVIPQRTRQAVIAAAKQLGYRPNLAARLLASMGKTNTMALWICTLTSMVYLTWVVNFQREAKAHSYELMISEKQDLCDTESGYVPLPEWPVDGIFAYGLPGIAHSLDASPNHIPIVVFGPYPVEGLDFVGLSFYDAGVESVQDLISRGRRRIAYVSPPSISPSGRYVAYLDVMREAGLETEEIVISSSERAQACEAIKEYLGSHACPDALVCCNDDAAIGVLRGLRDLGISVPGDAAIVGGDGLEDTEFHEPRISTIAIPYAEIARTSWEYMERRSKDPSIPRQETTIQARYIIRESSV
jgi:DNA-binding LacI/PurR family transcriptional regulator